MTIAAPNLAILRPVLKKIYMTYRFSLLIVGIFGISGVGLGAFGAHLLRDELALRSMQSTWETAVSYQLIHTVALLALVLFQNLNRASASSFLTWTARLWTAGILLFSGSLYVLAMGGPKIFGPITPMGGIALLAGWGCIILEALHSPKKPEA